MFAIQVWRVTHVWDRIDNVLREDYNMYAMIFTLTSTTNIIEWTFGFYHVKYMEKREFEAFASIQILESTTTLSEEWRITQVIKAGNGITHSSDEELALQPFTGGQKRHKADSAR